MIVIRSTPRPTSISTQCSLEISRKHHAHIKVLERDPIISVWALEQCLEHGEVVPGYSAAFGAVRYTEEDCKLRACDARQVARPRDRIDKLVAVQKPARSAVATPGATRSEGVVREDRNRA